MPLLNKRELKALGPLIDPFGRSPMKTIEEDLREGEDLIDEFKEYVHIAISDGTPEHGDVHVSVREVETHLKIQGTYKEKSFLWVIDESQCIKMIREKTPNPWRPYDNEHVCHTNLTGKAFIGGELFFCEDGTVYMNPKSDRFGRPSKEQWKAAVSYFKRVGYEPIDMWEWSGYGS